MLLIGIPGYGHVVFLQMVNWKHSYIRVVRENITIFPRSSEWNTTIININVPLWRYILKLCETFYYVFDISMSIYFMLFI